MKGRGSKAASILNSERSALKASAPPVRSATPRDQHAPDAIIKLAKEKKCDLIVVGSHGRGSLGRILLGSTSLKVLTFSQAPVLVCR
jgi:nucleotide-binding universal stress UspA family protein